MFPSRQQVINGIKLRAVAHVLMNFIDFSEYTEKQDDEATMSIWLFQINEICHMSNICCLLRWTHLFPAKKASPLVTTESPVSILKVLVFPAPLTPSRPKHWNGNDAAVSLYFYRSQQDHSSEEAVMNYLSWRNAHTETIHSGLLFPLVHL